MYNNILHIKITCQNHLRIKQEINNSTLKVKNHSKSQKNRMLVNGIEQGMQSVRCVELQDFLESENKDVIKFN